MLTNVCAHIKNYFCEDEDKRYGAWTISDGHLSPSEFIKRGQYFCIIGSVFNDGVHCMDDSLDLEDEEFTGAIWPMRIPKAFLQVVDKIEKWQAECGDAAASPFSSESFGGYSYSKSSDKRSTWQSVFAPELNPWRKI